MSKENSDAVMFIKNSSGTTIATVEIDGTKSGLWSETLIIQSP